VKPGCRPSLARLVAWLLLAGSVVAATTAVGIGVALWPRPDGELARLRARVEELQAGARVAEAQRAALGATAAALDGRVAELDRAVQSFAQVTPETPSAAGREAWAEVAATQAAITGRLDELERRVAAPGTPGVATTAKAAGDVAAGSVPAAPIARPLPASLRLTVAAQKQRHNLSCESCAASMAARYHGVNVSEEEILAALPRADNPHLGFRGNVDGAPGGTTDYGVYAAPVAAVLADYGLDAHLVEGGLAGIRAALTRGNPVVAWMTYDCVASTPLTVTVDGERVVLVPYQHAVVVTGYDAGGVWANDPWDGGEDYYPEADFERAMGYLGHMAIEVAAPGD